MQVLKTQLKDERAELFRKKAMEKFGHSKGAISSALNEAIDQWLKTKTSIDVREFRGIFRNAKDTSLELQKKAVKLWAKAD